LIDPLVEDVISPPQAARMFALGLNGKYPHVGFIYRAMKTGCRGIILESIRTPKLATSRQAVARFIRRMTEADRTSCKVKTRTEPELGRSERRVEQELDRPGI
jgi:hypothetical protein